MQENVKNILITGAHGMLGSYLRQLFQGYNLYTLGLHNDGDFSVDLRKETPDFKHHKFYLVIHCAGTEEDPEAMDLNFEGTKRLLNSLESNPPRHFVFVSSYQVYSNDAGEKILEDTHPWATSIAGKSKALAEELVKEWARKNDITTTIIRPARMFGNGVKGEILRLFNDACSSKYIHIRGNDAKISMVCALDVALAITRIYTSGGIYNVSDGREVRFIDMVESLTANAGAKKRMTHLPLKWAEWTWRLLRWIPSIHRNLNPEIVEKRMKSLTLDSSKIESKTGIKFFDTIAVIERRDKNYPYTFLT